MNILILSNPARGYYKFFNALAAEFASAGDSVHFAVDCDYTAYINRLDETGLPVHNLANFASSGTGSELLQKYQACNLNSALLSDFERSQLHGGLRQWSSSFTDELKSRLLDYFESIIIGSKIDVVIFENVSDIFAYFCWFVCDRLGVHYCGMTSSRLPGRFVLTGDPLDEAGPVAETLENIRSGKLVVPPDIVSWCANYIEQIEKIVPDYMKFNGLESARLTSGQDRRDKFRVWWGSLRFAGSRKNSFKIGNPLQRRYRVFRRALGRRLRIPLIRKYYDTPREGERYLLYPLHFHPESSTSVLAPSYLDEYEVIRNIAFNLPEGTRLYVKDHASAFGLPSGSFYETLSHLPNVRLIEPFARTKELIRRSAAVITLTSTVGYEALLMGKRVFLYGRVFYEFHPNVVRVSDPARLFELFGRWLDAPLRGNREYNQMFVEAYYSCSLPGVLDMTGPGAAELAKSVYPDVRKALLGRARSHGFAAEAAEEPGSGVGADS